MNDRENTLERALKFFQIGRRHDDCLTKFIESFNEFVKSVGIHAKDFTKGFANGLKRFENCHENILKTLKKQLSTTSLRRKNIIDKCINIAARLLGLSRKISQSLSLLLGIAH